MDTARQAYNPHKHTGHVEKVADVKVDAKFYNASTGEMTGSAGGPNKTQKRKHQINSLAQSAISRELELMEQRGKGNLSKSQTQAKYGW